MTYLPSFALVSKTTTYTATSNDYIILVDTSGGAVTVNLPTAVGIIGKEYVVKNMGTSNCTVDCNGSETIDGALTKVLTNKYSSINFISNNANWLVI